MSGTQKRILLPALMICAAVSAALGFAVVRARTRPSHVSSSPSAREVGAFQGKDPALNLARSRNLSLQPEAFNLGRRLGQRFDRAKRERSVLVVTLTIGNDQQNVRVIRKQTDNGEEIEIATRAGSLNWKAAEGGLSASGRASGAERELIEKLVFDSADQFVLAQLRGASYYTVAQSVRPEEAGDNYKGPLWNIVRVDDPQRDEQKRAQSPWRLYYLNTTTGLIDKIVSEIRGERVEANLAEWTDLAGEKFPSRITWTRQGQLMMELKLNSFAHSADQ